MNYFPRIRSKNYSLNGIRRKALPALPVRSIIRFGSVTPTNVVFPKLSPASIVEINSVDAVRTSSSKLLMKRAFDAAEVSHPAWYVFSNKGTVLESEKVELSFDKLPYPIVAKRFYGSKARGMQLLNTKKELEQFCTENDVHTYYLEHYVNMSREYRLHCTADGCFYTCRKMLKRDAKNRWYRNDSNCVWILEENPDFNKPTTWKAIEEHCVKALKEVGLDFGAFDVRVQSSEVDNPGFVLIEINSAPSFGEVTEIIPKLIMQKANANNR